MNAHHQPAIYLRFTALVMICNKTEPEGQTNRNIITQSSWNIQDIVNKFDNSSIVQSVKRSLSEQQFSISRKIFPLPYRLNDVRLVRPTIQCCILTYGALYTTLTYL